MLIYILNLFYFFMVYFLVRVFFGRIKKATLYHVFFVSYCVFIVLSSYGIYSNGMGGHKYLIAVYTALPLCIVLLKLFDVFLPMKSFHRVSWTNVDEFIHKKIKLISFLFVLFVIFFVLDIGFKNLSIVYTLTNPGDFVKSMELRIDGLNSRYFGSIGKRIYGYMRASFIPCYMIFLFLCFTNKKISRLHFYFMLLLSSFYLIASASKAPLAYLLFGMVFSWYLLKANESISFQKTIKLFIYFLVCLFIPALIYPLLIEVESAQHAFLYALEMLERRVFWVPSHTIAIYFEYYGNTLDHLGFSANSLLAYLSGNEYVNPASQVFSYYSTSPLDGLINSAFFSSFYAMGGWVSFLVGCVIVSFTVAIVERLLKLFNVGYLTISVRVICSLAVIQLMMTNYFSVLLGRGLILLPLIYIAINIFVYRRSVK